MPPRKQKELAGEKITPSPPSPSSGEHATPQQTTETSTPLSAEEFKDTLSAFKLSIEQCISNESKQIRSEIQNVAAKVEALRREQDSMKASVSSLQTKTMELDKHALRTQIALAEREQRERNLSIRIFGMQLPDRANILTSSKFVYNALIKPALQSAYKEGDLLTQPTMENSIEFCHKLSTPPAVVGMGGKPPTIILRFTTRLVKFAFMSYRVKALEDLNSANRSAIRVSHDLCRVYLAAINRLKQDNRVESVFHLSSLKLTMKADPKNTLRVLNPFGMTVEEALKPP